MRLFFFVLFSIFCLNVLNAQQIVVLNEKTKSPIPNVAIYNEDKSKSTISDFDGIADISKFLDSETLYFQHVAHIVKSVSVLEIKKSNNKVYLKADENQLSEVVISISKWQQDRKDIVNKIASISPGDIALSMPQTSADLLQSSGQVYIQKSQLGGGSPIIRGFSTNRLLLTVDGVRMNTAIFRGGNVQNVISIDPFSVERTEVILGPGSVVYGSDAIGGVMNFYTLTPKLSTEEDQMFSANASVRYATASKEKTGHLDFNLGYDKWGFLTSISYTDFDDLKMGTHGPDEYLRNEYVTTINGEDVVVQNDDPETQVFTGYSQINLAQKIQFKPNETWKFDAGFLYSTTSDYPRYDRLIRREEENEESGEEGNLISGEWFYGPQKWLMGNLQVSQKAGYDMYDKMRATIAYQNFQESRNDRDFGDTVLSTTEENVDAYSLNLDFEKKHKNNNAIYYGLEYVLNQVGSQGSNFDNNTNVTKEAASRYPDGSTWQSIAAYLSFQHKFNEKLRLQSGMRYNHVILYSQFDNKFFDFPFEEANLDTGALTGSLGISWLPNDILQWKLNFSTAFRAPNIDDIGKIFDSEPGSVVVPNPDLKHEYAYNGELGLRMNVHKNFKIDLATYYTYLNDALVRRDFNLNGATEILYGGKLSNVQAIQNASNARIFGFEAGVDYQLSDELKLISKYSITGGDEDDNGERVPTRHVAPQFGDTHLTYTSKKWKVDAFAIYNGEFSFFDLAASEQAKDYLYAIDRNGNPFSPSWYTLNLRSEYQITDSLQGNVAIENITDQRYRTYSSGIAAAGRNFIFSLKYSL